MRTPIKYAAAITLFCASVLPAQAADTSNCELLHVQVIPAADGPGEARIASYSPAEEFLSSIRDDSPGHITQVDGLNIQAVMCRRNDIIPTKSDYDVLATGLPFILSQDFDSPDTDSLTMYWKDGQIEHVYKGYPLSEEADTILENRLAAFSKRGIQKAPK